jgi:Holliday junction resolvase RusA-like endonuclease
MKIVINLPPVTKKNHQEIRWSFKKKQRYVGQSDTYLQYEKDFMLLCPRVDTVNTPVNIKALYYMPTHRKVDLSNLHSALLDCLVVAGVLEDDDSKIVVSLDGSRVLYDKDFPRTEIEITEVKE